MYLVIIEMTLDFSGPVMSEAVLTYIGLGAEPGTGSWGRMLMTADRELPNGIWWNLDRGLDLPVPPGALFQPLCRQPAGRPRPAPEEGLIWKKYCA